MARARNVFSLRKGFKVTKRGEQEIVLMGTRKTKCQRSSMKKRFHSLKTFIKPVTSKKGK